MKTQTTNLTDIVGHIQQLLNPNHERLKNLNDDYSFVMNKKSIKNNE